MGAPGNIPRDSGLVCGARMHGARAAEPRAMRTRDVRKVPEQGVKGRGTPAAGARWRSALHAQAAPVLSLTARSRLAHGAFGCLSAVYQVAARQSSLSICVSACVLASTCRHHRTATAHTGQHAPGHRRTRACTWGASVGRVLGQVHGARTHRVVVCLEDEIVATVVQMVLL